MANASNTPLTRAAQWYNLRPIRERALILLTALVLVLVLVWELGVTPLQQRHQNLENRIQMLSASRDDLLVQQQTLNEQLATDPSRELLNQLNARQQRLGRLNAQIADTTGQLIAPKAMVALLREMLAAQDSLALQALELQTPTPVFAPGGTEQSSQEKQASQEPLLYAHGVELRIKGSYLDVLNYLERLEAMDERLGWIRLQYSAGDWPSGEAVIRVQTLSLDRAWLGV
ncbi:MSHA biogenesis protein MshJ [Marinobacter maroccanus]|uniref:MSHA biogenesis protein MshJ n=1 Tax=Marinobacter maroccanus TaxID=2055143 RepID=A0A2S5Z8F8_9GAMM|nr:type II secretion system protein GspM [Marinobacter maroccanus]PPI83598.1 MSHA biogenesis protein MshJ [Marinobacter maroccanus]